MAKNIIVTVIGVIIIAVNCTGVKTSTLINDIITVAKLTPILAVAVIGIFFIHPHNFVPFFQPGSTPTSFANATVTLFFVFTGVESLVITAGNMKNPAKNLPKALLLVIGVVTLIYMLVMITCIGILGPQLAKTNVPLQDAATAIAGRVGESIIIVGTFLSMGGMALNASFISPRLVASLADNRQMPLVLGRESKKGAPIVAIFVHIILVLLVAYSGSYQSLVSISVVSRFAQYIPTCLAVIVLRRTMKNKPREFKIPGGYTIPILALVISVWLLAHTQVYQLIAGFGALVLICPFYFITGQNKRDKEIEEEKAEQFHQND